MARHESVREHVRHCAHPACKATRKLQESGARLVLGKGRHCEFAVLAAAGMVGLKDSEIVTARREYARHLGVSLDGRTDGSVADADYAIHAKHAAAGNVNGERHAIHSIPLGSARVIRTADRRGRAFDRYQLQW
jgi:hypothetical protein